MGDQKVEHLLSRRYLRWKADGRASIASAAARQVLPAAWRWRAFATAAARRVVAASTTLAYSRSRCESDSAWTSSASQRLPRRSVLSTAQHASATTKT